MFKSSLEICSQGYNIEQTDYYIANLEDRIAFAENAYADAVRRIEALEAQNEALTSELKSKLALITEKLGFELPAEPLKEQVEIPQPDADAYESGNEECVEIDVQTACDEPDEDITNLKSQIDELKSFLENN